MTPKRPRRARRVSRDRRQAVREVAISVGVAVGALAFYALGYAVGARAGGLDCSSLSVPSSPGPHRQLERFPIAFRTAGRGHS